VSPGAWEKADFVARWIHVVAGIMWVGNSLLFNWLDRNLRDGPSRATDPSLRSGQVWLLHSGGFYYVEKTLLPGQKLPIPLHWFKWQAYTTWLSGFGLLIAVYWFGGRAVMQNANLPAMPQWSLVAIGAGVIFFGWVMYEIANRWIAPHLPRTALALWLAQLVIGSYALSRLLDGRAAYLHVGAMLGTIMAGNVFFTIIPSQRHLVRSVEHGEQAKAIADSARAKRVSIHNNYFTFPVLALMISYQFPSMYGAYDRWSVMLFLVAGTALVRHILNVRYTLRYWPALLGATAVATLMLIHMWQHQQPATRGPHPAAAETAVTFADARHVIDRRCAACHSATPTDLTFGAAPGGVTFDTPEQIAARVARINERAEVTRTMPPANKTHITDEERDLLRRWIAAGAPR
jgi:uncharacterized membrane protein